MSDITLEESVGSVMMGFCLFGDLNWMNYIWSAAAVFPSPDPGILPVFSWASSSHIGLHASLLFYFIFFPILDRNQEVFVLFWYTSGIFATRHLHRLVLLILTCLGLEYLLLLADSPFPCLISISAVLSYSEGGWSGPTWPADPNRLVWP